MMVCFLDIDGVLNDHSRNDGDVCGFKPSCVAALNLVIKAHPHLKFIISSAWRYLVAGSRRKGYSNAMTLQGFEYMMRICGCNVAGRIIGITPPDEEIPGRGNQIKAALKELKPKISHYLVVDDMPEIIGSGLNLLSTDPGVGLTEADAQKIIEWFNK